MKRGMDLSLKYLPGYPFFPCKICQRDGFSGRDNDGCDHTALERARASGINFHAAPSAEAGKDH